MPTLSFSTCTPTKGEVPTAMCIDHCLKRCSKLEQADQQVEHNEGGVEKALALLADIPSLITKATDEERRALLREVFDVIYLTPHR
jgi:hypothetical protein